MNDMTQGRPDDGMVLIEHLPFETDDGIASRARLGLLVLATDFTIEHEWRAIMAGLPGVALYESRILNDAQITPETLRAMERGCNRRHPAGKPARRRGLWLHLRLDGDRRGESLRAHPVGQA